MHLLPNDATISVSCSHFMIVYRSELKSVSEWSDIESGGHFYSFLQTSKPTSNRTTKLMYAVGFFNNYWKKLHQSRDEIGLNVLYTFPGQCTSQVKNKNFGNVNINGQSLKSVEINSYFKAFSASESPQTHSTRKSNCVKVYTGTNSMAKVSPHWPATVCSAHQQQSHNCVHSYAAEGRFRCNPKENQRVCAAWRCPFKLGQTSVLHG